MDENTIISDASTPCYAVYSNEHEYLHENYKVFDEKKMRRSIRYNIYELEKNIIFLNYLIKAKQNNKFENLFNFKII